VGSSPIFHPNDSYAAHYQQYGKLIFESVPTFGAICAKTDLRKLLPFEDMYPFKKAKLNDCAGNISKRWYIEFYAWDVQKSELIRKRFYEVNNIASEQDRRIYANRIIQQLNKLLKEGYHSHGRDKDKPVSKNVMGSRYRKLTKDLKLNKDYTLYSWKHSGVVAAYKAGIDIKTIQSQCRHHSLEQTDIYLKSLGLNENLAVNMMPEL